MMHGSEVRVSVRGMEYEVCDALCCGQLWVLRCAALRCAQWAVDTLGRSLRVALSLTSKTRLLPKHSSELVGS